MLGRRYHATIPSAVVRAVVIGVLLVTLYSLVRLWRKRPRNVRIGSLASFGLYSEDGFDLLLGHPDFEVLGGRQEVNLLRKDLGFERHPPKKCCTREKEKSQSDQGYPDQRTFWRRPRTRHDALAFRWRLSPSRRTLSRADHADLTRSRTSRTLRVASSTSRRSPATIGKIVSNASFARANSSSWNENSSLCFSRSFRTSGAR